MKQTAVEWLVEQIKNNVHNSIEEFELIVNQAKEMEKEQIIEAHGNKQKTRSNTNSIVTYGFTYTGEMYYNEIFKGIKER
jgi:fatty acid-binding protein DegV